MNARSGPPGCTVDFEAPGRQIGYLRLAHSDNRHAYGLIPVPIACINAGEGPTALVTAGNHGDEHEGVIIARRLIHELAPAKLRGRVIVMPALNYPAVLADARVSPLDGANMNRSYPGDAGAGPTAAIARFVESVLLPMCDASLDLHSGGKASQFSPCAFLVRSGKADFLAAKVAAARAFGAPTTTVVSATADGRSLSAATDRAGVLNLATELGGGGTVGLDALAIGDAGTRRWLAHVGVLDPALAPPPVEGSAATRFLETRGPDDFVMAPVDGLFEPAVGLGDEVRAGQLAGYLHAPDDPARDARAVHFAADGVVVCRRVPARARRGDYLFHIGTPVDAASLLESR